MRSDPKTHFRHFRHTCYFFFYINILNLLEQNFTKISLFSITLKFELQKKYLIIVLIFYIKDKYTVYGRCRIWVADCMVAIKSVTKLQNNVISRTAGALGYTVMFDMLEIGP